MGAGTHSLGFGVVSPFATGRSWLDYANTQPAGLRTSALASVPRTMNGVIVRIHELWRLHRQHFSMPLANFVVRGPRERGCVWSSV